MKISARRKKGETAGVLYMKCPINTFMFLLKMMGSDFKYYEEIEQKFVGCGMDNIICVKRTLD